MPAEFSVHQAYGVWTVPIHRRLGATCGVISRQVGMVFFPWWLRWIRASEWISPKLVDDAGMNSAPRDPPFRDGQAGDPGAPSWRSPLS